MNQYIQTAIKAAKSAGKIQLKNFGKIKEIKDKGVIGLATNVDFECEKTIVAMIMEKFPGHNIVAEEFEYRKTGSDYAWLIDPLDGTHNYVYQLPMFGVSIALEYKKQVILGVIYLPVFGSLFVAEKNKGAFLNGKRIRVSKRNNLKNVLMQFDGAVHMQKKRKLKFLDQIVDKIFRMRISGCAVWDLSSVAMGKSDFCVSFSTKPWDVAAGFLIIQEAGGKITDFKGNKWNQYMKEFIATNGLIHNQALKIVKNV